MVPGPMYGELLNQEDRERRERERVNTAAYEELSSFACNYKLWTFFKQWCWNLRLLFMYVYKTFDQFLEYFSYLAHPFF